MKIKVFLSLRVELESGRGWIRDLADMTPVVKAWYAIRNTYRDAIDTMSIRLASDLGAVTCAVVVGAGMFGVVG